MHDISYNYLLSYLNIPTFFKGCCSNHLRKWYFLCHPKHPSNQHLLQDAARRIALMRYIQIQELHGDIPMQVGEVRWLVLCMNDPSKNPLNNFYILVEMFAHFLVVFYRNIYIYIYNCILYIAVIPVLWSSFTQIFCWRFIISGHGFVLMWHVVTSPRPHCSPSKVWDELRLDHDGEVLQCAEQVVYIYIYK